jgi:hypothetical protein
VIDWYFDSVALCYKDLVVSLPIVILSEAKDLVELWQILRRAQNDQYVV